MELTKLPNIGPELARQLNEVDIRDSEELKELGAEMACLRMKAGGAGRLLPQAHRPGGGGAGNPQDPAHPGAQGGAADVF